MCIGIETIYFILLPIVLLLANHFGDLIHEKWKKKLMIEVIEDIRKNENDKIVEFMKPDLRLFIEYIQENDFYFSGENEELEIKYDPKIKSLEVKQK